MRKRRVKEEAKVVASRSERMGCPQRWEEQLRLRRASEIRNFKCLLDILSEMLNKQWIRESGDRKRSVWDWSRFGWHFKSEDQGTNVKGPFREDAEMEESLVTIDEGTRVVLCTGPTEMRIRKGRRVHKERWEKAKDELPSIPQKGRRKSLHPPFCIPHGLFVSSRAQNSG